MNKKCFTVILFAAAIGCNTEPKSTPQTTATDSLINSAGGIADSVYEHGAKLITENDCLTCHKINEKSFGPSYNEISSRYPFSEGATENLAHSIMHGSKGLWGTNAMTPHSNLRYEDAKAMARYILSLKHTSTTHPNTK